MKTRNNLSSILIVVFILAMFQFTIQVQGMAPAGAYVIVDTDQHICYNTLQEISAPQAGAAFYGQDAQFQGNEPAYRDNGDGTVTDLNTGLMWQQSLPDEKYTYAECITYAENSSLAGYTDWRLPTIKELYSLILFSGKTMMSEAGCVPEITNEAGEKDYPCYWTSSTHLDGPFPDKAVYIAFGRAMGCWQYAWTDVHGAGAQRSDPKEGDPADYPEGHGPQGDAIRIYNYVRLVRTISVSDTGNTEQNGSEESGSATLFAPIGSNTTYLVDGEGEIINSWESAYRPGNFSLNQNYPNPFNSVTAIGYSLSHPSQVELSVFNLQGRYVKILTKGFQPAGNYQVIWDGTDENGLPVSFGIYICHLITASQRLVKKMSLLK